ncbi:MAG: hypothetical protein ACLSUD_04985 [Lachnospiraceae bacterium]|jgi:hypothetical protein
MKINRQKFDLARARACMGPKEIEAAGFPRGTLSTALNSENVRPETAGRLAKALGVDVTEIIEEEN